MRPTRIRALTISPAGRDWDPLRPGDVELRAAETRSPHGQGNPLGDWEAWLIGGAFRDRSAQLGLPRVVVVAYGSGADRVTGGRVLSSASPRGLRAFHRRVAAAAAASGAPVLAVRTGRPSGYSAEVSLQVADPVAFLRRRLGPLQRRLDSLSSDGVFLALYEADGRPLYVGGRSARLQIDVAGVSDPRYRTCIEYRTGGPATLAPPLPCPSGWRPPASTPQRPLALHGWASGGVAARGIGGGSATIAYRPGTTLGLGFVLENPNGHAVTVQSITPAVGPRDPIHYTGARIQIAPSRSRPAMAADLQQPYRPEPPLRPFTIQPGDWAGVGLHYRIARACGAATAGSQITENRTLTITYTLQGRAFRRTYRSTALTMTVPADCGG